MQQLIAKLVECITVTKLCFGVRVYEVLLRYT